MRAVGAEDLKCLGVAGGQKPFSASIGVTPPFKMDADRVVTSEEVVFELRVAGARSKAFQVRLATCGQFAFTGIDAATWAVKGQHVRSLS